MKKNFKNRNNPHGQMAIELAVFGAILIFILSIIIRQALGSGYQQNHALKAIRMALLTSFEHSEGLKGGGGSDGNASRNSATILLIEDRLVAEGGKYGAMDRAPYILSATGTHSRNLFMPVEAGEDYNVARFDVFVNGKHFPLTTARLKTMCLAENLEDCYDLNINRTDLPDGPLGEKRWLTTVGTRVVYNEWIGNGAAAVRTPWVNQCVPTKQIEKCSNNQPPDYTQNPICGNSEIVLKMLGCRQLYTILPNHPVIDGWCSENCPLNNLSLAQRFDLDRDGKGPDVPDKYQTPAEDFSWQWQAVMGYVGNKRGTRVLPYGEDIYFSDERNRNIVLDVDGDLKEERIMRISKVTPLRVIVKMEVMDFQDGDLDFTKNSSDPLPRIGFTNNLQMTTYTETPDGTGTYLTIEEGKLYEGLGDNRQYVRQAQKRDHVDIIHRELQMSNNTGRFCPVVGEGFPLADVDGEKNPVDVCCQSQDDDVGCCFKAETWNKTCFDTSPKIMMIFVRSNLQDWRGHKWITDISSDDYIDLQSN